MHLSTEGQGRYSIGDGPNKNDSLGMEANGSGRDTRSLFGMLDALDISIISSSEGKKV
jgi:hypothetical protein